MDRPKQVDLAALIEALVDAGVEFIVIGGAAAVLHGAPTTTLDLAIVHRRTPGNLGRPQEIMVELHAVVRNVVQPERAVRLMVGNAAPRANPLHVPSGVEPFINA